jgi:hypothetical protein
VSIPPGEDVRQAQAPAEMAAHQAAEDAAAQIVAELTGPVSNHEAAMNAGREPGQRGRA